jgi:hypothetical protein
MRFLRTINKVTQEGARGNRAGHDLGIVHGMIWGENYSEASIKPCRIAYLTSSARLWRFNFSTMWA